MHALYSYNCMHIFFTDVFSLPSYVFVSRTDFISKELTFHWSPVAPECPTITYNTIASNCGKCPSFTNNNTIICTDVPTNGSMCTFAIRIVFCRGTTGNLSNTIQVILNQDSGNYSQYMCTGAFITAVLLGGVIIGTICASSFTVVCVTITIMRLRRSKVSIQHNSTGRQYEDVKLKQSPSVSDDIDTRKNVAYGPSTFNTKKNVAYDQVQQ